MKRLTVSLLALLAPFSWLDAMQKPNIVFILADDLGYGDLGCYNKHSKIPTPNLDRLASEGMRFKDAHSPSSVTRPPASANGTSVKPTPPPMANPLLEA